MTKIHIAARYDDDTPYAHGLVTIRCVDADAGRALPNGLGVAPATAKLDADGEATVTLTPNDDITPAGTYYAITVDRSTPTLVRYIEVPEANGSGEAEIPYEWDDDEIQRLVATPPDSFPAAASGTVNQVLGVVNPGAGGLEYGLVTPGDATTAVSASAALLKNATTAAAYTTQAGFFGVSETRKAATASVLPFIVDQAGTTQSHINHNASGAIGAALSFADRARGDATAALGVGYAANLLAASGGVTTLTVDQFDLNADAAGGEGTSARASWSTPAAHTAWTGLWARRTVTVLEDRLPADPSDGDTVYSEGFTQVFTAGDAGADTIETVTIESVWSDTLGRWQHWPYHEHTPVGESTDSYKLFASQYGRIEIPAGIPTDIAAWIDFDTDDQSRGLLLVGAGSAPPEVVADGDGWLIACEEIGDPTSIEVNTDDDWQIGLGFGHVLSPSIVVRDGGPSGTTVASPTAEDATDGDTPFDDDQSNTWTPEVDCAIEPGTPASGGGLALGETSTTAYRGDRGKTAYDHTSSTSNPHSVTAAQTGNGLWYPPPIPAAMAYANAAATPTVAVNSARWLGQYIEWGTATAGRWIEWEFWADAGTWTLDGFGETGTTLGTSTIKVDGSTVGTWNQYNAGGTVAAVQMTPITGIVIGTTGRHTLRAENTAAGAGAGTYNGRFSAWLFRRTA